MRHVMPALAVALVLSGCASLSDHPEFHSLSDIGTERKDAPTLIGRELRNAKDLGNNYLKQAKALETQSTGAGAGVLGFGLYGAAVAAFNPAPKNLLAALLGGGTFQAWRTALKPGERAKVYVAGYRALDCIWIAGGPLEAFGQTSAVNAAQLRQDATAAFIRSEEARRRVVSETAEPEKAALLARLDTVETALTSIDAALLLEANVMEEAPNRIAKVRRQIEGNIDKRLDGLAPDYAGALKILNDSSKLPSTGDKGAPTPPSPSPALVKDATPAQLVARLEVEAARIKRKAPSLAATAYADLGHCVEVAG